MPDDFITREDFERRRDDETDITTDQEFRLLLSGGLYKAEVMRDAKKSALDKARKKMIKAVWARNDAIRQAAVVPPEVKMLVDGQPTDIPDENVLNKG